MQQILTITVLLTIGKADKIFRIKQHSMTVWLPGRMVLKGPL